VQKNLNKLIQDLFSNMNDYYQSNLISIGVPVSPTLSPATPPENIKTEEKK